MDEFGQPTGVTATMSGFGLASYFEGDITPLEGTPANDLFAGRVNFNGLVSYQLGFEGQWWMRVDFTGLDPTGTYSLAASANRGGSGVRTSYVSLFGVDTAEAAHASTPVDSDDGFEVVAPVMVDGLGTPFATVDANFRNNGGRGLVVRWNEIHPGADGTFTVYIHPGLTSGDNAYGPQVFRLAAVLIPEPAAGAALLGLLALWGALRARRRPVQAGTSGLPSISSSTLVSGP